MKLTIFFIYGFLVAVTFLIFALLWHGQMANVYFVSDRGVIGDFLPPFLRVGDGNVFLKPVHVVYTIWAVYIGLVLLIPAVATWLLLRLRQREINRAWM